MKLASKTAAGRLAALLTIAWLAGCGGGSAEPEPREFALSASGSTPQEACTQLVGLIIPASAIGLPTSGAVVLDAVLRAAGAVAGAPEHCKVTGDIRPVDPQAPPIKFQVNLPTQWNAKSLHFGGGGFNGVLVTGEGNIVGTADSGQPIATPLGRGYVTFGSDSGHQAIGIDAFGSFALNDEALYNYGGDAIKKTSDVAAAIVMARYGSAARWRYIAGGSKGGHEAFTAMQRYANDYDGVIAYYPAYSIVGTTLQWLRMAKAAYVTPGGHLSLGKQTLVTTSVMNTCDDLDGARDGLISNIAACRIAFDVRSLRCPLGIDLGDICLSDTQIATLNVADTRADFGFALANGQSSYARFPVFEGARYVAWWMGPLPVPDTTFQHLFYSGVIKHFYTRDPSYPPLSFEPIEWRERLQALSPRIDATSANLDVFKRRGGKLLLVHGSIDFGISVHASVDYWNRLRARYGERKLANFARFYTVPGYAHGGEDVSDFTASWDSLTALENWAEREAAPADPVIADGSVLTRGRTRPLCEYPMWPRYLGSGDVSAASSFNCVQN